MGAGYRPTPSVTPSSPTGTLSACVSVRHLVLYSRNTIQLTIQLYCSIHVTWTCTCACYSHRHAFPPAPYSAIQRHTALYEHTAIQHHTAYSPYNTPQSRTTARNIPMPHPGAYVASDRETYVCAFKPRVYLSQYCWDQSNYIRLRRQPPSSLRRPDARAKASPAASSHFWILGYY